MRKQLVVAVTALMLTGCAARTAYRAPVSVPLQQAKNWKSTMADTVTAEPASDKQLSHWWSTLGDDTLTQLEERALAGNIDLRVAAARVRQAKAQREASRGALYPQGNVSGSASGSRASNRDGDGQTSQSYSADLTVSWEPDLSGRIGGTVDAYTADVQASEEDLRDVMVSLTAEVATNYVDLRSYQAQLAVTRQNLSAQQETAELTEILYQSGLTSRLDVEQARTNVESTKATIPTLEASMNQAANRIAVLLGERPGALDEAMRETRPVPAAPSSVAVGVPADLLRRRPDIRSAERQVAAQSARVGVATANLKPTFALAGTLSLRADNIQNLFTPASLAANAVGSVAQTVFNRKALREQVNVQDAVLEQAVATYEATVLTAVEEVENALTKLEREQVRRQSLQEAARAADQYLVLAQQMYNSGLQNFLTVLDAQRSKLTLENQLAQSQASITNNLVQLYKALGGGWS
ncbi:MAG: efflux transporter outer membrane subunit [Bryobacterales bacterium]|nr:efflux transporter outer membrane subunit [Bryobacterales bacterium]